ncbi:hypothetical protein METBIDRAFT_45507 [Metschnikowia bicuspidata var. bicuspidata NRRL YB-4993]|uniref:Zn(2)-C6 fungal-type domain-containing protein n=1 Tax=Metschnikowia bicuspidata var. bicuspidata NRRL YB-4993 TaxID=869754 RepID=A0A1A0H6Q3_9ASCO|nr:hypothetical protein METBIDRAFT_45507 [Metschnikowia bicuspidata var. bicuspidata NRRL YB-4993]OBA19706.1 hypothetical protein METBIDRAFT_45507 [Metschnikowia bicuspidata var. bicuspidata NRRL YB-4993]
MVPLEKKKITRVRLGCHRCKKLKVKCPEQKPTCATCLKAGASCDYSIKLTWGGRPFKNTHKHKPAPTPASFAVSGCTSPDRSPGIPAMFFSTAFSDLLDSCAARAPLDPRATVHLQHAIGSPQPHLSYTEQNMDRCDSFSADLARIERTFPTEQRLPFFDNAYGLASLSQQAPVHSIPPLLVPLPEILLKVPYYRQLLHFWVNVAAENLVPAPYLYKDNPFKIILPQMAMHYPGLLTTILAFAARARDDLEGSPGTHLKIIDQLLGRSCDELLRQLRDHSEATSDGTFATSLLLSSFEVVHSNDFSKHRAHTTGASQIMAARARKFRRESRGSADDTDSPSSESSTTRRDESDIAYFLLRWFMYVDVLGALSSTQDRMKYLRAYRTHSVYTPIESIPHLNTDDWGRDIDFLLGFDPKLLPHFVNISLLIDEVEKYMATPGSDVTCLPIPITVAALELKEKFLKSYEAGEAKRLIVLDEMIEQNGRFAAARSRDLMTKDNILRSTNRLYYNAGLLNLYRRVLLLPRLSCLVQDLIAEITDIFELYIEPCSPAEICTIFCLFCAGCDNLNEEKRAFYRGRFEALVRQENMNAIKSLVIMDRCWDTGEDWYTAANMLAIDLVLL